MTANEYREAARNLRRVQMQVAEVVELEQAHSNRRHIDHEGGRNHDGVFADDLRMQQLDPQSSRDQEEVVGERVEPRSSSRFLM
jgi:hypothetical protein